MQDSRGAADPDVGATLHVTSSVKDSTDALVSARVECEVQMHSSDATLLNLLGSHDGVDFERPILKAQARICTDATDAAQHPIVVSVSPDHVDLVKEIIFVGGMRLHHRCRSRYAEVELQASVSCRSWYMSRYYIVLPLSHMCTGRVHVWLSPWELLRMSGRQQPAVTLGI